MRVIKRDWYKAVSENNRWRITQCRYLDGHAKEPYEMSMAWEADHMSNFNKWNIVEFDVKQPIHSLICRACLHYKTTDFLSAIGYLLLPSRNMAER